MLNLFNANNLRPGKKELYEENGEILVPL